MPAAATVVPLARADRTRAILRAARARLAADGPDTLTLAVVAHDVGITASTAYRYVPGRDALLTMLLVEIHDELGTAVERGEARAPRDDLRGRWLAAARALRAWSLAHPAEFALLNGTPGRASQGSGTPGPAPQGTADRVVLVLLRIVVAAWEAGGRRRAETRALRVAPGLDEAVAPARAFAVGHGLVTVDAPTEPVMRTLMAWIGLFGALSFELLGHLDGAVTYPAAWFDALATRLGTDAGVPEAPTRRLRPGPDAHGGRPAR